MLVCRPVYDLTTLTLPYLTYIELEHAESKQHIAYLGVVNRHGRTKNTICGIQEPYQVLWSKNSLVFHQF